MLSYSAGALEDNEDEVDTLPAPVGEDQLHLSCQIRPWTWESHCNTSVRRSSGVVLVGQPKRLARNVGGRWGRRCASGIWGHSHARCSQCPCMLHQGQAPLFACGDDTASQAGLTVLPRRTALFSADPCINIWRIHSWSSRSMSLTGSVGMVLLHCLASWRSPLAHCWSVQKTKEQGWDAWMLTNILYIFFAYFTDHSVYNMTTWQLIYI